MYSPRRIGDGERTITEPDQSRSVSGPAGSMTGSNFLGPFLFGKIEMSMTFGIGAAGSGSQSCAKSHFVGFIASGAAA
jgi:hypothetical protein